MTKKRMNSYLLPRKKIKKECSKQELYQNNHVSHNCGTWPFVHVTIAAKNKQEKGK
jgi:hypothetical protein